MLVMKLTQSRIDDAVTVTSSLTLRGQHEGTGVSAMALTAMTSRLKMPFWGLFLSLGETAMAP